MSEHNLITVMAKTRSSSIYEAIAHEQWLKIVHELAVVMHDPDSLACEMFIRTCREYYPEYQ